MSSKDKKNTFDGSGWNICDVWASHWNFTEQQDPPSVTWERLNCFIGHFAAFQRNIFNGGMLKKQICDHKPASWKGNCNILQVHTPKITYTSWLLFSLQHTVNNVLCRSASNKAFKCIYESFWIWKSRRHYGWHNGEQIIRHQYLCLFLPADTNNPLWISDGPF